MSKKSALNEMVIDTAGFEISCGDRNYFEALWEIKNNDIKKNLRDEELNSLYMSSDYSTMFMTF